MSFEMNDNYEVTKRENGRFYFPLYVSSEIMHESIAVLDLSVRSINCLKRVGYNTIGDIVNNINKSEDLRSIKNCGQNSAKEIINSIFEHQMEVLSEEELISYWKLIYELNCGEEL